MDTRVLKYFLEVAREGNITKAAENLHITQPTLSRQLMDLEAQVGTNLFIRGKRQVTLTESGILFQQRAKEIVLLIEKTERDLAAENDLAGSVIAIGYGETAASCFLPRVLTEFTRQHPMVKYELYSAGADDIREKIDRGDIDIGILLEPVEVAKYDYIRLPFYERWGVVMRADDPLAGQDGVRIQDISNCPVIVPGRSVSRERVTGWLGAEAGQFHIVASHNLLTNALPLVESGFGYAVCVEGAYRIRPTDTICFRPFEPEQVSGHVLAWKKNRIFTFSTSLFIQHIRDMF